MNALGRFMEKVEVTGGCWHWKAAKKGAGYGAFYYSGALRGAHRVALSLFKGFPIDMPLDAMHSCDNPGCVNPAHLSYGTKSDNMRDAARKGRTRNVNDWRGTKNPRAKLSEGSRAELEALIRAGFSAGDLAQKFGLSKNRIYQIKRELAPFPKKAGGGWNVETFS